MGYRNYFYLADKELIERVARYTNEDVGGDDDYQSPYELIGNKRVHEFGKLYFSDMPERITAAGQPLFICKELIDKYNEYDCTRIGEAGIKVAIECYREMVMGWLTEDLKKENELLGHEIKQSLRFKQIEMEKPFDFDQIRENRCLSDSWVVEYSMFNLLHVWATTDWNKQELIWMGY